MENKELSAGKRWLQRIGLALSGFGGQIPKTLVDTFASVFLVTAVGISPAHIATMLLVSKIIDAITDYLVGVAIDKTKVKIGRNRFWMLLSIPVTVTGLVMLFMAPGFGDGGKLAWAYISYNIVVLGLTMASVSANAIVPFLSSDPKERGIMVSAKLMLSMVGSMAVTGLVSALVNLTGGAESVPAYTKAAMAIGVVFAVIIAFSVFTLHEKDYELPKKEGKKSNPLKDLGILFTSKNFIIVLVMGIMCMITQMAMTNGAPYYAGYALGDDKLTGSILMPVMGGALIPMLLMGFLSKRFTKKQIVTFGAIGGIVFCGLQMLAGSNGILLTIFSLLEGASFGMAYVSFFAMQPDVIDEVAYKSGQVMSGLQSALAGFACNLGAAIAAAAVTWMIGLGGFKQELTVQPEGVATFARLGTFVLPIAAMVVILIAIQFYDFDKHAEEVRTALGKPVHGGPDKE